MKSKVQFQYFLNIFFGKLFLGIYIIFLASPLWAETEQEQAIQAPVDQLHETLISIMESANSTRFEERYALVEMVITENFYTPLIARVVLSRYWKSLDEKTQFDFIALFNRLTIATYVDRFDSFDGESFNNLSIEPMKKNRFMVKTEFVRTNDKPVSFSYIVQNDNEQWKIISVIANGINDLSLKRAEYSSVIKKRGFAALVTSLEEKISDLQPDL
ncbi:MAG: ABC transporter substrate-binding protein [Proteobacteria bacterium]|nr:ABC transporter substrate-binding protein [Pseudomonadota bacterium]